MFSGWTISAFRAALRFRRSAAIRSWVAMRQMLCTYAAFNSEGMAGPADSPASPPAVPAGPVRGHARALVASSVSARPREHSVWLSGREFTGTSLPPGDGREMNPAAVSISTTGGSYMSSPPADPPD